MLGLLGIWEGQVFYPPRAGEDIDQHVSASGVRGRTGLGSSQPEEEDLEKMEGCVIRKVSCT